MNVSLINNQLINKKKGKKENIDKNMSKMIVYDFFSKNEINISNKICKIPYYSQYYNFIITDYDLIDISQISEKIIENIILDDDDVKYILCYYKYENCVKFHDFLFNIHDIKQFILNIFNSYLKLLNSLLKLNNENICFFDLNTSNIVFSETNNPFLCNFKNSLFISSLNENYIQNVIKNVNNYTCKPLEVHVLFYLIRNNEETLSLSFIETICNNYVKNMSVLSFFSQKYQESYKQGCIESLTKYINKHKSVIITDILNYYNYWDSYSITIIYLHIFGNISRVFSLKGTILNKLILLLSKNIHPNPSKRETLNETIENCDKIMEEFTDWSFINNISNEKLEKLYDILK